MNGQNFSANYRPASPGRFPLFRLAIIFAILVFLAYLVTPAGKTFGQAESVGGSNTTGSISQGGK